MSRWTKKGAGRRALLPLLFLALALGGAALFLASLNLLLTTTAWGQNLCQRRPQQQQVLPIQEPNTEAQIFFQNVWEKHQFLFEKLREERSRRRRSAPKRPRNSKNKPPLLAAHYEVKVSKERSQTEADSNGAILPWIEVPRNSTSPLRYDEERREFIVIHKGLYYLYCQVHFNEDRSSYIKLDLLLNNNLIFRCLQEFSATAASIHDPKVKTCSVSGLVILNPGSSLRIHTLPRAILRGDAILTYFGLFQLKFHIRLTMGVSAFAAKMGEEIEKRYWEVFLKDRNDLIIFDTVGCNKSWLGTTGTIIAHILQELIPTLRVGSHLTPPNHPSGVTPLKMPQGVLSGWAQGAWGGTGAWGGVLLCLVALLYQSLHLESLQRELSLIQKNREDSRLQMRKYCDVPHCPRQKRELASISKRHNGNRALLHLVPESIFSNDSADRTEILWKVALHEGKSLEVEGRSVRVKHSGIYSIYSQVFYRDSTFTMGHLVLRQSGSNAGDAEILLSCVQSMPSSDKLAYKTCYTSGSNAGDAGILLSCVQSMPSSDKLAYNTCYTSGVFRLRKGYTITLEIPRGNATLDTSRQATFLGFIKL
ncbi:uncharacterized protein [Hyperolius riggenbachi]|uniref:uncharacterized protein n=1 Tax=Hyperolius riggenbachi TaxID=752182 RepID=UPI0035A38074